MKKYLLLFCLVQSLLSANYVWLDPESISCNSAMCPSLVLNSVGDAISVWLVKNNDEFILQAGTKLFGQPWDTPLEITRCQVIGDQPWQPKVGLDSQGNAIAVWSEADSKGRYILQSSSKPLGQEWSTPYCLSTNSSEGFNDVEPQLAEDETGNAILIWKRSDGVHSNVLFATKSFDQGWSNCSFFLLMVNREYLIS